VLLSLECPHTTHTYPCHHICTRTHLPRAYQPPPFPCPTRVGQEWARLDRPYCTSDIFKELILDNATASEAECREVLRERLRTCQHGVCPQCVSPCNYPIARTVASVFKCVDLKRHFGFLHYYMVTDAGQLARSMHGARRKDNYISVPEKLAAVSEHGAQNLEMY
tara:strand:- start:4507 stop:5001 length:495 start_codon:yes stop_codon:yes gene_type:complete